MARLSFLAFLTAASGAFVAAAPAEFEKRAFAVGQTVKTSSGSIVGHAAPVAKNVSEYLGIPYAQPPVGKLRFAAPVAYNSSGSFQASSFGPTCASNGVLGDPGITGPAYPYQTDVVWGPQGKTLLDNEAQDNYPSAEDCLTLNVWTKPQSGEAKKAVMVWIYGGGYNFGSTKDPWYNGQYLADKQDVVVVTVNYRTSIFGFPGAPGLPQQNAGLLDQRLAMEWVRDNIAGFGGDPACITMFGQSAGGASVDYYSFAWYDKDPIINSMAQISGTVFFLKPVSNSSAENTWWKITNNAGCGGVLSPNQSAVLDCMRSKSTQQLLNATASQAGLSQIVSLLQFAPVVDNVVAFDDYPTRAAQGKMIQKPLLIGNTDKEAYIAQPVAKALYGFAIPTPILDLIDQQAFDCPTQQRTYYHVLNKLPTWRYRWFGTWANTVISYDPDSGAYHEADIPAVFGTTVNQNYSVPDSAVEKKIVGYMQAGFAAFAKDPVNGLGKYGWPQYDGSNNLLLLAQGNSTTVQLSNSSTYDGGCSTSGQSAQPGSGSSGSAMDVLTAAFQKAAQMGWPPSS